MAFVDRLRAAGHAARLLDVRVDDLDGSYDAVMANAVLLHLTRDEFADALLRAHRAVVDGGALAFTLREGNGDGWSDHKLGRPRHFTFWREDDLREALDRTGWHVVFLDRVEGRPGPWLLVIARSSGRSDR